MDVLTTVVDTLLLLVLVRTSGVLMANRRESIIKGLLNESVYDNRIPPNYEDNFPTDVTIQVFILSFDSVTEASMDYSATIFLREYWEDKRLRWGGDLSRFASHCNDDEDDDGNNNDNTFSANCSDTTSARHQDGSTEDEDDDTEEVEEILERLELDSKLLDMVWMPDLYFLNDKEAHIHDVTTANRMLHIYRNGTIRTSSRISMTLSCDMYLEKYPHDEQNCSMLLASYSYSVENVLFHWHDQPVMMREGVTLPRFQVRLSSTGPCNMHFGQGSMITGNYTCIRADFRLMREFGYYIAQVYVPSCLIVALSWVSFWIDLDAIPARVSLGLLTVLTMTTQSTGEKASLPRVSYLKAIDVWMAGCLVFVFAALLEFAYANVQSRVEKRRRESYHQSQPREGMDRGVKPSDTGGGGRFKNGTNHPPSETEFKPVEDKEVELTVTRHRSGIRTQPLFKRDRGAREKARRADKCSRVIFPIAFFIFNIIYWVVFVASPL